MLPTSSVSTASWCCFSRNNKAAWIRMGKSLSGYFVSSSFAALRHASFWKIKQFYDFTTEYNSAGYNSIYYIIPHYTKYCTWLLYINTKHLLKAIYWRWWSFNFVWIPSAVATLIFFFESKISLSCYEKKLPIESLTNTTSLKMFLLIHIIL